MQQTNTKEILDEARLGGNGNSQGLCKGFKFEHTTQWYMNKPKSVRDNETYRMTKDFEIQIDHFILIRRLDQWWLTKKRKEENLLYYGRCHPADQREKIKESEKVDKYLEFAKELKKKKKKKL